MTNIRSNYGAPLALPGGPTIPPKATVAVDRWRFIRNAYVVQAWLEAKVIEVVGEDEERATAPDPASSSAPATDQPKTAAEVLAMVDKVHFQTFKAEAVKVLGDGAPSTKGELIAALEERATAPE